MNVAAEFVFALAYPPLYSFRFCTSQNVADIIWDARESLI